MDSDKYNLPIYTLRTPFLRTYVVNDTRLIPALQKQWRIISFAAQGGDVGRITGMTADAVKIINREFTNEQCFSVSWPKLITPALAPGRDLNAISRASIEVLIDYMEDLRNTHRHGGVTVRGLWQWTRHTTTKATTEAFWGPMNPYQDSAVFEAWKIFESGLPSLPLMPLPHLLAPKLFRARETVAAAMIEYMRTCGYMKASAVIQKTFEHNHNRFGLSIEDVGRGQLGLAFAVLSSLTPFAFWLLYHIFSDEVVLADVRAEVESLVLNNEDGMGTHSIDLAKIPPSCPLLLSTFQETMRYRSSASPGMRKVLDDVMVEGWFLKKGSILLIPNTIQHTSTSAWGESAATFDHRRFVRRAEAGQDKPLFNRTAFRAFGGGHTLCPGRHFAINEVMTLAALMVLQFNLVPVNDGKWPRPTWRNSPIAAGVPVIDEEIEVEFILRDPDKRWNFISPRLDETMALVSDDMLDSNNGLG